MPIKKKSLVCHGPYNQVNAGKKLKTIPYTKNLILICHFRPILQATILFGM